MHWIAENIARVRVQVAEACTRSGRDPCAITLMAVTKGVTPALVRAAAAAGITDFGESRIDEAREKITALADLPNARWHCVGHVQTNKASRAVQLFPVIHSISSTHLLEVLERRCADRGIVREILLEVNVSGEPSKQGASPAALPTLIARIVTCTHLAWTGLMTMAPRADTPEQARATFHGLRVLRDRHAADAPESLQLSMGMSDDFTVAVEEGADIIRVGRRIFEETS
jgi:PLP dependent protein